MSRSDMKLRVGDGRVYFEVFQSSLVGSEEVREQERERERDRGKCTI